MHLDSIRFQTRKPSDQRAKDYQSQKSQSVARMIPQILLHARHATATCLSGSILILIKRSGVTTTKRK